VVMVLGLIIYLSGRRWLPPERVRSNDKTVPRERMTRGDWVCLTYLIILIPVLSVAMLPNQQIFNAYLVWGDQKFDLRLLNNTSSWLITVDAAVSFGDGAYTLTLTTSSGGTSTTTVPGSGDNSSAEWITEAPSTCTPSFSHCKPLPLTNFGSVDFSGTTVAPLSGDLFQITMVTRSFTPKAVPGPFDGNTFAVSWAHK